MNSKAQLTPHEMLELHEIIRSEALCSKKIQTTLAIVDDPDLRSFMQLSLQSKKDTLTQYQALYNQVTQQQ
ncbi:MAG: hypothetical protein H7X79_10585 [Sporomusaceae bacterium]|nr:hypothetical protein [Sporomusaceae bacterium]